MAVVVPYPGAHLDAEEDAAVAWPAWPWQRPGHDHRQVVVVERQGGQEVSGNDKV